MKAGLGLGALCSLLQRACSPSSVQMAAPGTWPAPGCSEHPSARAGSTWTPSLPWGAPQPEPNVTRGRRGVRAHLHTRALRGLGQKPTGSSKGQDKGGLQRPPCSRGSALLCGQRGKERPQGTSIGTPTLHPTSARHTLSSAPLFPPFLPGQPFSLQSWVDDVPAPSNAEAPRRFTHGKGWRPSGS